jgi:hypothetical protein
MSIAVMDEGDVMGKGIPPDPKIQNRIQARQMSQLLGGPVAPDTVPVFGAGPAGLLAAHAVALVGREPIIFTLPDENGQPIKSRVGAATYLHSPIPDITGPIPDGWVTFSKIGTASGYAYKVYGDRLRRTSWDKFEGRHPAWDLRMAYAVLWERYAGKIVGMRVTPSLIKEFVDTHPIVISSIPPSNYCENPSHEFPQRPIWSIPDADSHIGENEIRYDGTVGTVGGRYRSSRLFGHASTEYAEPVPSATEGFKVLPTTCDCQPDILRVGRFGEWMPGVLVDHAFSKTWNVLWDQFEGA